MARWRFENPKPFELPMRRFYKPSELLKHHEAGLTLRSPPPVGIEPRTAPAPLPKHSTRFKHCPCRPGPPLDVLTSDLPLNSSSPL